MSAPQPRLLETYNSLTDKHLVGYFSNARIRRHLQKSGLISRSGRIIPEKELRANAMRREQQRHARECLADAIFQKVLDMERHHHREMKNYPDCSVRKDRMQPIKMEPIRESVEEIIHVRCPHPPLAPRSHLGLCPSVAAERAACSHWWAPVLGASCCCGHCLHQHRSKDSSSSKVSSLAPKRAPGHFQHPPRLQPLHGWAAPKASQQKCHALGREQQCARGGARSPLRIVDSVEYLAVSPYQLPVTCPCAPPPRARRGDRRVPALGSALPCERRSQPSTAFNQQVLIRNTRGFPKSPLCSNAFVTMLYLGRSKHVSLVCKDEIKVYQQYCGTENICVYRGELLERDTFQFISKRHLGFPFSLTFFINDTEVERLSSCCEYRHLRSPRARGRNSYFRILHVAGAPPCYKCIIAMGLDRKLNPAKRKARSHGMRYLCPWECALHCGPCEACGSSFGHRSREDSASGTVRGGGTSTETVGKALEDEEESSEEEMENQSSEEEEDDEEDTSKKEYEEDFEAYEEVNEEGQAGDQMKGMPDDKNLNLDYGKESPTSSQKALGASGREKDESDGYSDEGDSEDDLQEGRPADSVSSMGTQCSTDSASHAEMVTDNVNGKEDCNCKRTSESAAHAHDGNENGEKKLLRMGENQETSALEKKGIGEAEKTEPEDLTAREDTRISHEDIMAMQHQNAEVNEEFKQTGSGGSTMNEEEEEEEEECAAVPWGSRAVNTECEEGGVLEDCRPVQEETAEASGTDHAVSSAPEPGDSCASEEEKNTADPERGASGDGSSSVDGRRSRAVQEGQGTRAGQVTGQGPALGQDGAAEPGAEPAGTEDPAPGDGTGTREHPGGTGTGEPGTGEPGTVGTGEPGTVGTAVSPGQQEEPVEGMERKEALGEPGAGGEGPADGGEGTANGGEGTANGGQRPADRGEGPADRGQETADGGQGTADQGQGPAGALPAWGADRAGPQGQEGAGGSTEEEEEAAEEELAGAEEQVGQAGQSLGLAGEDTGVAAVSQGQEAVEHAGTAAGGNARAVGPEGEEAGEEGISEREEAVWEFGVLWEALGDTETGGAVPGEEGFVKLIEFSQLKASGEEWMEMGKAGAAAPEGAQAREVAGNEIQRAEETVGESAEPAKGPVLGLAPGLEAPGDARGDPGTEGSPQEEEEEEEEAAAETLRSGNPKSEGSKAETQRAVEGNPGGEEVGGSAGAAAAGSGGDEEEEEEEEEGTGGTAGSEEPAAGTQGWPRCAKGTGQGTCPGQPGLCGTRAGEPGLVAIAVVGGQPGPGALAGELALARGPAMAGELALAMGPAVAGAGGLGTGAVAQEGVTGAALGARSGTGAGTGERLGSPMHGEGLGAASPGEQPSAGASPSSPGRGDGAVEATGRGSPGGERLCPGTEPQTAGTGTGTAPGTDGRQGQGMGRAGGEAEGQQGRDSPLGGGPGVLAAAGR